MLVRKTKTTGIYEVKSQTNMLLDWDSSEHQADR